MTHLATGHEIIQGPDGSRTRYSYFDPSEETVTRLMREIFEDNWQRMTMGPCHLGSVFELSFDEAPKLRFHNGYLTIDPGPWHCHLCIGTYRGGKDSPESWALRRVAKIAFYEWRGDGSVKQRSAGIRLWNGYGEQMTTIFFPHVLLGETPHTVLKAPNWENLRLWYQFRQRYLGEPIPVDLEKAGTEPLENK
uniref:Uncharacterized protein n=1 Tax=Candidatus Kentrum sp. FW TaxID=2126338 RepID=A0A450U1H7_9GAMM|nr:MAG: hypothetical protein BECKFW1821B_GA0114236_10238 [Candidatus Kentron sp. FW]VFJ76128.1 MAG: hypothetical protein BECKFW1821C_GA0114237_109913 [Candidatus Kentron sp. FW]